MKAEFLSNHLQGQLCMYKCQVLIVLVKMADKSLISVCYIYSSPMLSKWNKNTTDILSNSCLVRARESNGIHIHYRGNFRFKSTLYWMMMAAQTRLWIFVGSWESCSIH
jgi:hypothetical protein